MEQIYVTQSGKITSANVTFGHAAEPQVKSHIEKRKKDKGMVSYGNCHEPVLKSQKDSNFPFFFSTDHKGIMSLVGKR